jgi:hypothetical protein
MSAASSALRPKINLRSTAVKRIMQEAAELANPDEDDFVAAPLEVSSRDTFHTEMGYAETVGRTS